METETETKEPKNFSKNIDLCPAYVGRHELAFVRHVSSMNPCDMIFEVHKTVEHELSTFIIRKRAVLARPKHVMLVEVALQQMLAAKKVLSFAQGQLGIAKAIQTLERLALERGLTSR